MVDCFLILLYYIKECKKKKMFYFREKFSNRIFDKIGHFTKKTKHCLNQPI